MGANHVRVLSNLEGVDLVGAVDVVGISRSIPQKVKLFDSVSELIKLGIDYCVIASPTASHEEVALELIDAGIHILVEKPVTHSYESAIKILKAAEAKRVIGAVGHIERYNAALQQVRKRLDNGDLGSIYQIATRRQGPFPDRIADVGVVKDLATHDIDITSWITGKEYLQVSAYAAYRSGRKHEDLVTVSGMLRSGIAINHVVNWVSPLKERKVIITGEKGTFVVDTLRADLTYYENGKVDISMSEMARFRGVSQGDVYIFAFEKPEPLVTEHKNFCNAVRGIESEIVTLEQGAKIIRVAEAILESSKSLKRIHL